jgi:hypothetical protein
MSGRVVPVALLPVRVNASDRSPVSVAQPQVGKRMPELMRMNMRDASIGTSTLQHLPHTRVSHRSLPTKPQLVGRLGSRLPHPESQIPPRRIRRLCAEPTCRTSATFTHHEGNRLFTIDVVESQTDQFSRPHPGVQEQPHDYPRDRYDEEIARLLLLRTGRNLGGHLFPENF